MVSKWNATESGRKAFKVLKGPGERVQVGGVDVRDAVGCNGLKCRHCARAQMCSCHLIDVGMRLSFV